MNEKDLRTLKIHVPMLPPSPNCQSRNWYMRHREEKKFAEMVLACAKSAINEWDFNKRSGERWTPLGNATMKRIYTVANKRGPGRDINNLDRVWKKAIDALTARTRGTGKTSQVGAGVIEDDGDLKALPSDRLKGDRESVDIEITSVLR